MQKLSIMLTMAVVVLSCTGLAFAGDDADVKLDGKQLYRDMCKTCHGVDSDAGEYTPMFLIQEQWEIFFEEDYVETHKGLTYEDEAKTEVLKGITPEMLEAIRKFCHDGAADSEQPMTCG
jgi:mono/diheme cytochrome c family protein